MTRASASYLGFHKIASEILGWQVAAKETWVKDELGVGRAGLIHGLKNERIRRHI